MKESQSVSQLGRPKTIICNEEIRRKCGVVDIAEMVRRDERKSVTGVMKMETSVTDFLAKYQGLNRSKYQGTDGGHWLLVAGQSFQDLKQVKGIFRQCSYLRLTDYECL